MNTDLLIIHAHACIVSFSASFGLISIPLYSISDLTTFLYVSLTSEKLFISSINVATSNNCFITSKFDELEKLYDDPIAHFQARVAQLKKDKIEKKDKSCFFFFSNLFLFFSYLLVPLII